MTPNRRARGPVGPARVAGWSLGLLALLVASAVLGVARQNCPQLGGMQIGLGIKSVAGLIITSVLLLSTPWVINGGLEITLVHLHQWMDGQPG